MLKQKNKMNTITAAVSCLELHHSTTNTLETSKWSVRRATV